MLKSNENTTRSQKRRGYADKQIHFYTEKLQLRYAGKTQKKKKGGITNSRSSQNHFLGGATTPPCTLGGLTEVPVSAAFFL